MLVRLSPEKVRQRLLEYFEAKDDLEVKRLEPKSIQVRTLGPTHPWVNITIGMFGEENRTRLTIAFSFRKVYAIVIAVTVIVMVFCWVISVNLFEAIVITTIIGTGASITSASEISKTKRKYLNDIRKAFDMPNKTD